MTTRTARDRSKGYWWPAGRPGLLAVLLLPAAVLAQGEDPDHPTVGMVADLHGTVTETELDAGDTPTGDGRTMAVADPVRLRTAVATGPDSEVMMTLEPNGVIELGPRSREVISEMRVDQATGKTEGVIQHLLGVVRLYFSRAFGDSEVEVDTPTATIGIKGTELVIEVVPSGDTAVWLLEGAVEVRAKAGGEPLQLTAGNVTVIARGQTPTPPTPFDPGTGATASGALPPDFRAPQEDVFDDPPVDPLLDNLPPRREPLDSQQKPPREP